MAATMTDARVTGVPEAVSRQDGAMFPPGDARWRNSTDDALQHCWLVDVGRHDLGALLDTRRH